MTKRSKTTRNRARDLFMRNAKRTFLVALAGCTMFGGVACTRAKYRYKTNREAYYLIDEKIADSGERTAPYRIEVDPQSRMFDPFNPDRPPMPEDDPVANRYMKVVDRKKGYPLWEANGRTNTTENPDWISYLPLDERGVLVLDLNQAVRLALLHSPGYQNNLETLFLSALDVSAERFVFDSQFFGGWRSDYTSDGRFRQQGSSESRSVITTGPGFGSTPQQSLRMRKQFATGTDLLVSFANTLSWQVSGPADTQNTTSILGFSLTQPLLRQGGRDVVLERLTLSERLLLANVRAFERYRRGFYVNVATGNQLPQGPARSGGVFGGAGLSGFTGLGGGFGTLNAGGNQNAGGGFANNATPGANGFLGLLQNQLTIINTRENIERQRENLRRLEDNYRELLLTIPEAQNIISQQQLQVVQTQQALFTQQTTLLQTTANYEAQLDTFKRTLGLPPYLCVEIRDPMLDQFNLISIELRDRRDQLDNVRETFGETNTKIINLSETKRDPETKEQYRAVAAKPELTQELTALSGQIQPLKELEKQIFEVDFKGIKADIQRLREVIPTRRQQMDRLANLVKSEANMICALLPVKDFDQRVLDSKTLDALPIELEKEVDRLEKLFRKHAEKTEKMEADIKELIASLDDYKTDRKRFDAVAEKAVRATQDLIASIAEDVLALQLVQARARTETVVLPEVDIEPRDALEIARQNRHDWLNAKTTLVNQWRAIEFVADDLESVLDLTFSGDMLNANDNPLSLRSATGRLRVGLAWDAPITRLQERNNYRQSLIEYQRAKRTYYQFEDTVWQNLRTTLRSIRQNQLSFELQRYAVRNAATQVSINEDLRLINETLSQASGPTTARDNVSALQDLLNSQSQLIGVWVNYEALRRVLDLDLGTMQIDADGLWIDPIAIRPDTVGGQLGQAILNYGLTESERAISEQLQTAERMPTELAPSNQLPLDARYAYGPAYNNIDLGPGLIQTSPPNQLEPSPGPVSGGIINASPAFDFQNQVPNGSSPNAPIFDASPTIPFPNPQTNIANGPAQPQANKR